MPVRVPVAVVQNFVDPFKHCPWSGNRGEGAFKITPSMVRKAIKRRKFSDPAEDGHYYDGLMWPHARHAQRIAWLVINDWDDAIDIDVGCPSFPDSCLFRMDDGHHRLAAAIYRGDEEILAWVSGELFYAKELFGVDCEEPKA